MSAITFIAMPTDGARAYQAGAPDANGQKPERHISDGTGVPCRHVNATWQLASPI
jgi:hypothetical protein